MREKIERKNVGSKESLRGKEKVVQAKQKKKRNSFTSSHEQAGIQPALEPGSITHNDVLGEQTPSLQRFFPPLLLHLHLFILSVMPHGMEHPCDPVGISCSSRVPSQFLVRPQSPGR